MTIASGTLRRLEHVAFVTIMLCCVWRDAMPKWVLLVQGGAVSALLIALWAASEREA